MSLCKHDSPTGRCERCKDEQRINNLETTVSGCHERIAELEKENSKLREWKVMAESIGCLSGDCPHDSVHDCIESIRLCIEEP